MFIASLRRCIYIVNTLTFCAATTLRWLRDAGQRLEYHGKHRVLPLEVVIVPETQDAVTAYFQIPGSRSVDGFIVMAAVEFHHEAAGLAGENDAAAADGVLAAELEAHEAAVPAVVHVLRLAQGNIRAEG